MRVRCWSDALLSSSADWARLRKPKTLHGYNTPQTHPETQYVNNVFTDHLRLESKTENCGFYTWTVTLLFDWLLIKYNVLANA